MVAPARFGSPGRSTAAATATAIEISRRQRRPYRARPDRDPADAYSGRTPQQILATDALAVFNEFGFREHLTPQRSNGLRSMVERIRSDAREALAAAS